MSRPILAFAASLLLAAVTVSAGPVTPVPTIEPEPPSGSPWQFEILPYLWAVNLDGTVGVLGTTSQIDVGFDDILDNLDFAGSLLAGVRYDRFGLLVDAEYVKVSPSFETPGPFFSRTDLTMEQILVDLKASYRIWESDRGWLDLAAGARYMHLDLDISFQPGIAPGFGLSGNEGWWDTIGGLRARFNLTRVVYLTALADVGGGGSDITWQALGGIGFQLTRNIDLRLVYRYLKVDYASGGFTYDVATQGLGLGLGLQF